MFIGLQELSIDDKNRLSIPASFRSSMDPKEQGTHFFLAPGEQDRTLELLPEHYYPEHVKKLERALTGRPQATAQYRYFTSLSAKLEVDKNGRVLLPQYQLQVVGLGRQILMLGCGDRLVLWNRDEGYDFINRTGPIFRGLSQEADPKNGPAGTAAAANESAARS